MLFDVPSPLLSSSLTHPSLFPTPPSPLPPFLIPSLSPYPSLPPSFPTLPPLSSPLSPSLFPQNPENLVVTSLMYADAVWDRVGIDGDDLSFRVGDVIEILDMSDDTWWQGNVREKSGWFPSAFVRVSGKLYVREIHVLPC